MAVRDSLIINDVVLVIYLIIGLFGNLLVIYTYVFKMKRREIGNRFFIPYLAVGDTLACAVGSGFGLALNLNPLSFTGKNVCKMLWFFNTLTTLFGSLMLLLIAIHRYVKICHSHRLPSNDTWHKISLIVIFFISIASSIPAVVFYGEMEISLKTVNITGITCGKHADENESVGVLWYSIFLVALAILGITTVTLLYTLIGKTIYADILRHRIRINKNDNPNVSSKNKCVPGIEDKDGSLTISASNVTCTDDGKLSIASGSRY